ncbi:hypothetical protein [Yoonia sp. 2307UL14-13]|uniref:hypothetical protein n=1 Tax=Yoonia sp. 2307UL14-13 TaxID=3126506 RepID=UPI0030A9C31F
MQNITYEPARKWSDDLSLILIYALVLGAMGYLTAVASIPDRAATASVITEAT